MKLKKGSIKKICSEIQGNRDETFRFRTAALEIRKVNDLVENLRFLRL